MMSINAVKGVEIGAGFAASCMLGSENNDPIIPGGFGKRGIEGKIQAIRFAREMKVPTVDPRYFDTRRRWLDLEKARAAGEEILRRCIASGGSITGAPGRNAAIVLLHDLGHDPAEVMSAPTVR